MLWRNGALVALVAVAAGVALAHLEILAAMAGFSMYAMGGVLGMLFTIGGLFAWARGKEGGRAGALLGLVPALALIIPMALAMAKGAPRINDITTDLDDPPALSNGATYPADFAPIVREHYGDLKPLALPGQPDAVIATAKFVAEARDDWDIGGVLVRGGVKEIRGVATTGLFKFRDDFTIRVRANAGAASGGTVVDMRSRSRDGQGDFGVNAERIRGFMADLQRAQPR